MVSIVIEFNNIIDRTDWPFQHAYSCIKGSTVVEPFIEKRMLPLQHEKQMTAMLKVLTLR